MGEMLSEIGDLVFTMVIGYLGAVEFLYVVRHLYHWSFRHPAGNDNDVDSLHRLQQHMRNQLATAEEKEALAGDMKVMQDGVLYKDGFRVDKPQSPEAKEQRRKEIEAELERQKQIEEETRKQLEKAEAELAQQRKQIAEEVEAQREADENTRKLLEAERLREAEQRKLEEVQREAEENAKKLLETERQREEAQRKKEEEEEVVAIENARKLMEAELQREEEQRRKEEEEKKAAAIENARILMEAELQREEEQRRKEEEEEAAVIENARILLEAELQIEEEQRRKEEEEEAAAIENAKKRLEDELQQEERKLIEAELQREDEQRLLEAEEQETIEMSRRLIEAEREVERREQQDENDNDDEEASEQSRILIEAEREREHKQKMIEENARKFLEAEQEMVELHQQMVEAEMQRLEFSGGLQSQPQTPVIEEPCIKKIIGPKFANAPQDVESERLTKTVKTQFGQASQNEPYLQKSKSLLFPGISDDGTSIEPSSSQKSSFSTQPSEEMTTTGADEVSKTTDMQFSQFERQEPDGEDNLPSIQYTDEYLRSLDGIKHRPLMREDGSGRRRAFKKRRSSGSSTSSRDSRHSRDEELKMFTSLEEEEMKSSQKGKEDFTPIKYSSEPTLKVKGHHRRHKRSPAKDATIGDETQRGSLEMLGEEEGTNPWGELMPEHYKNTKFWKREKTMSIDEEDGDLEKPFSKKEVEIDSAKNLPKTSSFEEATQMQSEEALSVLQQQLTKDAEDNKNETDTTKADNARSDIKTNLQTSQNTEDDASHVRSSASPRLRRSPRIDEMNQYEERWKETSETSAASAQTSFASPTISIQETVDTGPWRDEYGLVMQGLSDFYDFQASVNPSRSRSTSRNPTPAKSPPSSPKPKNVSYSIHKDKNMSEIITSSTFVDIYDDTGNLTESELKNENIQEFIESITNERKLSGLQSPIFTVEEMVTETDDPSHPQKLLDKLKNVSDDRDIPAFSETIPMICIANADGLVNLNDNETRADITTLVQSLRAERVKSRSQSKSPFPTSDRNEHSLETRKQTTTKRNDEIIEKLPDLNIGAEAPSIEIIASTEFCDGKSFHDVGEVCSSEDMRLLVETLRSNRSRSRSRSPLPTAENIQRSLDTRRNKLIQHNDEIFEKLSVRTPSPVKTLETPTISIDCVEENSSLAEDIECSQDNMSKLVESLLVVRSRSRSKSPMRLPTVENMERSMTLRRNKLIERNDEVLEQLIERAKTPESPRLTVEYIYEIVEASDEQAFAECGHHDKNTIECRPKSRNSRSRTPSRSQSASPSLKTSSDNEAVWKTFIDRPNTETTYQTLENISDYYDFHRMLNLEASQNRTLIKNSEELESTLAEKQRLLDEEAMHKLKTAVEEMELRTLSPPTIEQYADKAISDNDDENDNVSELTVNERMKKLRCSPTTPDYERTISEECRDVQRIKSDMLASGFKRSTYVGESMDLGSEYEQLRRDTAHFRRSQSPSPSFCGSDLETVKKIALERRRVQDEILAELTSVQNFNTDDNNLGAKPKVSPDYERSISKEHLDTQRIKDELINSGFKRSTYVGESVDLAIQLEEMRRETAEFRRSGSKSRSPLDKEEIMDIEKINNEAAKRELQDKILDEIEQTTINFQDFSRNLNADFFDNDRRASDSALMHKPDILMQFPEHDTDLYMEPEEYHHFRRYSLCQEQPVEEYPNDDYVYVSQIEVRTLTGTRTWIREDYYSDDFDNLKFELSDPNVVVDEVSIESSNENEGLVARDEEDTDGSEDERQTVVDVEDEIDTDICDFNERGPADESHHEQSECEEAEREMDRYAGRGANDWDEVEEIIEHLDYDENQNAVAEEEEEEGAIGGVENAGGHAYDSDSFTIDQIYNDAVRSRKQSGILRDYDCILQDMQNNLIINEAEASLISDNEKYLLWAQKNKTLEKFKLQRSNGIAESSSSFIDSERRDHEMRYLGDAKGTARQSARLHSRYGYMPLLQSNTVESENVDLNYKPKREYNWRKNFKLDEDELSVNKSIREDFEEHFLNDSEDLAEQQYLDMRKYSLGGESITLFSRSPEREGLEQVLEEEVNEHKDVVIYAEPEAIEEMPKESDAPIDKPKKKKSKKKTRKESNASLESHPKDEEDDSESQVYSRRSSSLQMETDSPKRKSRSRRSSKSSLTNDSPLFSPRSSVGIVEPDISEEYVELKAEPLKKKTKKRKRAKESFAQEAEIQEEQPAEIFVEPETTKPTPLSSNISPESSNTNLLSTLSPENSVCVTPASIESDTGERLITPPEITTTTTTTSTTTTTTSATTTSTTSTPVDNFDILKDANFYPLF